MAEQTKYSLLSDLSIKRAMADGSVVIEPFSSSNLATTSYDVTLGPYYFRETNPEPGHGTFCCNGQPTHFTALFGLLLSDGT